jgi:thioredoxin 1
MAKPVEVNDHSFDAQVLKSDLLVITDFWAEWCAPCRVIAPHLEQIAQEYDGQVKVVKLDIEANPQVTSTYGVLSLPTLIFFKNGLPVEQLIGAVSKAKIVQTFESYLIKE